MQLLQHLIDGEARRLLPWRKVLEGRQELADIGLRRDQHEGVIEQPVVVGVRGDVGALVRIEPEIEDQRHAQVVKGSAQTRKRSRGPLLHEDELPVVVAQSRQIAVVGEVEELLARALCRLRRSGRAARL